jgi:hypothetical protein
MVYIYAQNSITPHVQGQGDSIARSAADFKHVVVRTNVTAEPIDPIQVPIYVLVGKLRGPVVAL